MRPAPRLIPLGLLVAACATGKPSPPTPPEQRAAATANQTDHVRAMNAFALDLFPTLSGTNAVFSPASIYWALLLIEPGARAQSLAQLRAVLHSQKPHHGAHDLVEHLQESDSATLRIANGVFTQPDFPIDPTFLWGHRQEGAELRTLDFARDREGAQQAINAWVSEQTAGKIPALLIGDTPSSDTRLVLVNAVYFLATWRHPFAPTATRDRPFTLEGGATVQAPTMKHSADWQYGESGPVRVLELDYHGTPIVLDIVLPKDPQGLRDVEAKIAHLDDWLSGLTEHEVHLELPKFLIRATTPGVVDRLKALGLTDVFDARRADLSGIAGKPGDLVVSAVVHQAFIDVNEKGTEAAAATATEINFTSLKSRPPPVDFHVDHPFLFVLRDRTTQAILFLGRVGRP